MKILHIMAPGGIAGAEKSALTSAKALLDAGQEVTMAVITETRKPEYGREFLRRAVGLGLATMAFSSRGRVDFSLLNTLHRTIVAQGYDVVHTHGYKPLAYISAYRRGVPPIVATFHGTTSHDLTVRMYEWLEWHLFQHVDCLFLVSQASRKALEKKGPVGCRTVIVPNMLSESFPEPTLPKERSRPDPIRLLYLGRLSVEKGVDVLLSALAALPAEVPFELSVVGDGPERNHLEKQVVDAGLDGVVRFEGYRTNIGDYFSAADVLMMPSRTEGLPMTLVEAAAFGKPVIGSSVGGIPDIVEHEKNGILVPSQDMPALRDAILALEKNLYQYQMRSTNLAAEIREKYSPGRWADSAIREYERLCSR